jgi:hypothetical protein
MHDGITTKLDLRPLKIGYLSRAESVPVANQDHGRIPRRVAALLRCLQHRLYLIS